MTEREEDTIALAQAMEWRVSFGSKYAPHGLFMFCGVAVDAALPAPDATMDDHLRFVGHLTDALGTRHGFRVEWRPWLRTLKVRAVVRLLGERDDGPEECASDPSWAAMRAVIGLKRAKRGGVA